MPSPPRAKVCLVGAPAVGKTSLVTRFTRDGFNEVYRPTLGTVIHGLEKDALVEDGEGSESGLILWDIAGDHSPLALLQEIYFNNAKGILAVCDLARPETLSFLHPWVAAVRVVAGDIPVILAANKTDRSEAGRTTASDLLGFSRDAGCHTFVETSARTGQGVPEAFRSLSRAVTIWDLHHGQVLD